MAGILLVNKRAQTADEARGRKKQDHVGPRGPQRGLHSPLGVINSNAMTLFLFIPWVNVCCDTYLTYLQSLQSQSMVHTDA